VLVVFALEQREWLPCAVDVDCAKGNQRFASTAFGDHHAGSRLLPPFGKSHDRDGLCRKGLSQQVLNPRWNRVIELVQRGIFLKNARS